VQNETAALPHCAKLNSSVATVCEMKQQRCHSVRVETGDIQIYFEKTKAEFTRLSPKTFRCLHPSKKMATFLTVLSVLAVWDYLNRSTDDTSTDDISTVDISTPNISTDDISTC
jgi:hypothetical protein